jgi:hypothetical protein
MTDVEGADLELVRTSPARNEHSGCDKHGRCNKYKDISDDGCCHNCPTPYALDS